MKYAVVIEKLENNYCGHVPDLPVCVSPGKTIDEVRAGLREAIALYLDVAHEYGEVVPEPTTLVEALDIA
jgi:predicted RNase H-like HicB family nuclease